MPVSPFYSGQYQYSDLSQRLAALFANITAQKKQEERQRMLDIQAAEERQRMAQRQASSDELAKFSNMLKINEMRAGEQGLAPGVQEYVGGDETPAPPAERFVETAVPEQLGGGSVKARVTSPEERQAAAAALEAKDIAKRLGIKEEESKIEAKYRKPEKESDFDSFLKSKYGAEPTADQRVAARREWEAAGRKPGGGAEDAGPKLTAINAASARFEQEVKEYRSQRDAAARVFSFAANPSAAGDIGLIFSYMKLLDPTSVVREGEFATAQNAGGVPERIRAAYNKTVNGERLSESQRKDFLDQTRNYYDKTVLPKVESIAKRHGNRLKRYDIPLDDIYDETEWKMPEIAAPAPTEAPPLPSGFVLNK